MYLILVRDCIRVRPMRPGLSPGVGPYFIAHSVCRLMPLVTQARLLVQIYINQPMVFTFILALLLLLS